MLEASENRIKTIPGSSPGFFWPIFDLTENNRVVFHPFPIIHPRQGVLPRHPGIRGNPALLGTVWNLHF
jgi:hypothetical protein